MPVVLETRLPHLFRRGKVRDTYDLGDALLMVATDRISAFDVVLPNGIPDKGAVLTRLSAFWFEKTAHLVPNHYRAVVEHPEQLMVYPWLAGSETDLMDLVDRSMVVAKARPFPVECVARGYLAGSGWAEYQRQGTVCGIRLPEGLRES
ncbi:MAG: phosphoribosylaminoimidazolesuccinocarboxamide synthase, partial [Chloroflexi bacterium]|nr:phosphoribosylaminoimidazolesuccinocarboxamide synthase [Chloroflexota bacterium]